MKLLRRFLILSHRYLGIAISLLVVVWFASGMVMMYAGGMPRVEPDLRLQRLPALDLAQVRITPSEAFDRALLGVEPARAVLTSVMDRPAYRMGGVTVFADSGDVFEEVGQAEARTIASRFMDLPEDRIRHEGTLTEVDQWTLNQSRDMPLYKFSADDERGTELYVSSQTGDVSMHTTRRSRTLAWLGVIPHWLYFAPLRTNQALWYDVVVWTAELACVLSVLGLALAFTQWRRQRNKAFRLRDAIPYAGWMRWHYITGAVFGIFTLTWAYSGLLSMEPFEWTNATGLEVRRDVFTGGPLEMSRYSRLDPADWGQVTGGRAIKEMDLVRILDEPYFVARFAAENLNDARRERLHQPYPVIGRRDPDRLLVSASTLAVQREPFAAEDLVARLGAAVPDVPIVEQELLTSYDSYYYSRGGLTPLPVLRVKFADPAETWYYVDPEMSQVLAAIHRLNRVERWLYNGLHSLDFAFWYNSIAWDIGMIALCLGGLASSGIGLFLGIKRLAKGAARGARGLAAHTPGAEGNARPDPVPR